MTLLFVALALEIFAAIVVEAPYLPLAVRIVLVCALAFMVLPHWERMKA